jgi:hypothetical protein
MRLLLDLALVRNCLRGAGMNCFHTPTRPLDIDSFLPSNPTRTRPKPSPQFDVVKTRRQVFGASARLLEEGGLSQPPAQILRQLFRGIGPPLVTTGIVQTLNFGVYDTTLRLLRTERAAELEAAGAGAEAVARALVPENARLQDYFVAGACGGVSISFVTCPASLVKIQMQTTRAASNVSYWTIVAGMRKRGLVNGFYRCVRACVW